MADAASASSSATPNRTANMPPTRTEPAARAMENLLGSTMKCTLDDGRTVVGTFVCVDRLKNIILSKVVEERPVDPSIYNPSKPSSGEIITVKRHLSQAMVPGTHLGKVEIEQSTYDKHMAPVMKS